MVVIIYNANIDEPPSMYNMWQMGHMELFNRLILQNKLLSTAPFGTWKVLVKEKNTKKNYFFMFGFTVENTKENQI